MNEAMLRAGEQKLKGTKIPLRSDNTGAGSKTVSMSRAIGWLG